MELIHHMDHHLDLDMDFGSDLGDLGRIEGPRKNDTAGANLLQKRHILEVEGAGANAGGQGEVRMVTVNPGKDSGIVEDDAGDPPPFQLVETVQKEGDLWAFGNGVKGQLNACPPLTGKAEDVAKLFRGELTPSTTPAPPLEADIDGIRSCFQGSRRPFRTACGGKEEAFLQGAHSCPLSVRPGERKWRQDTTPRERSQDKIPILPPIVRLINPATSRSFRPQRASRRGGRREANPMTPMAKMT
jgi:hypothetical protein